MTFIELVNRLRVECGVSGPALSTAQNLTGESARMANWINAAWTDIQTSRDDWQWLRAESTFNTTAQQQFYTATEAGIGSTFANWKRDSFRCSTVGENYADEQIINFLDYAEFRNLYMYGNQRTTYTRPVIVTVAPDKKVGLGSTPDKAYVIGFEYYQKPVTLSADADEPALPTNFHLIIVYRAMMYYGGYEAASEVYQRGEAEYQRLYQRLLVDQMPPITTGPPLA
jgi:hypothetical protein